MQKNTLALWLSLLMMTMPLVGFTYDNDTLGTSIDSSSDARAVDGCTNSFAVNYDPEATNDDGSCKYAPILFSPNGGEEWDVGSTEEITWNATGWSIVSLSYSNDDGTTWIHIATVDNGGSHEWMVPDTPNSKALVRITVFGQDANGNNQTWNDENDRYFTIKANPTSNQCAKLIIEANGFVSPAWEDPLASASGAPYTLDDIVEWPAGSGQWWMSGYYNNVDEPGVGSEWTSGPCTCEDIWNYTQTVWDSSTNYSLYEVVSYNGALYYSLTNSNLGQIPDSPSDPDTPHWTLCFNATGKDCRTGYNGYGGPLWTPGTAVAAGEIYEYPANSGEFYIAHTASTQNVMAPDSITPDASEIWTDYCNCSEIWMGTGLQSVWDLADTYNPWYIVEWQAGSGELWIANQFIFAGQDEPDISTNWTRCGGGEAPGGPCSEFNGFGGPAWVSGSVANIGDIFEHPAGSGEFYMLINGGGAVMPDPGPGDEWSEACNCSEIWQGNNQPMWDSALATNNPSNPYDAWYIVGYGQPTTLYISEMNDNTMLPDATRWHHCGPTTCADASGPWPHWVNPQWTGVGYSVGDQVSFGNGLYISTMNNNMVWPNVPDKRAWIECNCSDLDYTSWDNQSAYGPGDVVVDNDGDYWIALISHTGVYPDPDATAGGDPPLLVWRPCDYCDLSDSHIDGVWNQNVAGTGGYDYGDIREYGGSFFISIIDGNQQEPTTDIMWFYWGSYWQFQFPIISQGWVECNCTEIANGNTYQSGQLYAAGDVVIGPDGEVWISMYNNNQWWPGLVFTLNGPWFNPPRLIVIPTWKRCDPTGGCGDDVPVWNPVTSAANGYAAGETVEWPANTGHKWFLQVTGSTDVPAFNSDWAHCKMLPSDWPDHDKTLPPDTGFVNIDRAQDMAICDSRAVEASGLSALEAEDATYLCSAELSIVDDDWGEVDDDEGRSDSDADCTTDADCPGIGNPECCRGYCVVQGSCTGAASSIAGASGWSYELQEDGSLLGTTKLPGVTCDSPILEDVIAGYTCTDNIALQLKKEWTAVSMNTLSIAFTNSYPLLDECRTDTRSSSLLCGSMTNANATVTIDGQEHGVVFLDPGRASSCGIGDPDPAGRDCICGVDVFCFPEWAPCVVRNGNCYCDGDGTLDDGDEVSSISVQVVPSVYASMVRAADMDDEIAAPDPDERDDDEDGVHNAWDTCPDTANGTATDSAGCEAKVKAAAEEGGGMPGFSIMLAVTALLGAIMYTNRWRRMD